ncbi:MAG TPA: short-chain dehydrogenase [Myxococcales bacterium]|mgnify:CR=1 FL=1|nr:short-chain dehydrogenase [Myxococcales bacterium]HAN31293.1 short-chain dehydrogenase [Myxococcales bacterium]
MHFEDKVVVVTGGAGALGQAVVRTLIDHGATVHVPLFEAKLPAEHLLSTQAKVHCHPSIDLTQEASVEELYRAIGQPIWASIHIAGGFAMAPIESTSLSAWSRMMALNGTSCFLSCREAVKAMSGGGRIVNVAAQPALNPVGGMVAYSASKAVVANLTQSLAKELSDRQIWVNAVVPSVMNTPANRAAMPDADHSLWPGVDQVASTILFLASPDNAVTSGALVSVAGRA